MNAATFIFVPVFAVVAPVRNRLDTLRAVAALLMFAAEPRLARAATLTVPRFAVDFDSDVPTLKPERNVLDAPFEVRDALPMGSPFSSTC